MNLDQEEKKTQILNEVTMSVYIILLRVIYKQIFIKNELMNWIYIL